MGKNKGGRGSGSRGRGRGRGRGKVFREGGPGRVGRGGGQVVGRRDEIDLENPATAGGRAAGQDGNDNVNAGGGGQQAAVVVAAGQIAGVQVPARQIVGVQVPAEQIAGVQVPAGQIAGVQVPAEQIAGVQVPAGQIAGVQVHAGQIAGVQVPAGQIAGVQVPAGQVAPEVLAAQQVQARQLAATHSPVGQVTAAQNVNHNGEGEQNGGDAAGVGNGQIEEVVGGSNREQNRKYRDENLHYQRKAGGWKKGYQGGYEWQRYVPYEKFQELEGRMKAVEKVCYGITQKKEKQRMKDLVAEAVRKQQVCQPTSTNNMAPITEHPQPQQEQQIQHPAPRQQRQFIQQPPQAHHQLINYHQLPQQPLVVRNSMVQRTAFAPLPTSANTYQAQPMNFDYANGIPMTGNFFPPTNN